MKVFKEIEQCIMSIEKQCGKSLKNEIINCEKNKLYLYHFGLGLWIRNNILTEESAVYNILKESGIEDKDTMSRMIIEWLHIYLKNKK